MPEGQIEVARQQPAPWRCVSAAARPLSTTAGVYRRRRPEATALYEVVRDNLETLLAAIDDGALAVRIPRQREACPRGMPGTNSSPTSTAGSCAAALPD